MHIIWMFLARLFRWLFHLNGPKCYICLVRAPESRFESVQRHGIYGSVNGVYYFHLGCVYATLEDPELYGHGAVDRALWISDKIGEQRREKEASREVRLLRIQKAKDAEFWAEGL